MKIINGNYSYFKYFRTIMKIIKESDKRKSEMSIYPKLQKKYLKNKVTVTSKIL